MKLNKFIKGPTRQQRDINDDEKDQLGANEDPAVSGGVFERRYLQVYAQVILEIFFFPPLYYQKYTKKIILYHIIQLIYNR
jgi:hypothetical protein